MAHGETQRLGGELGLNKRLPDTATADVLGVVSTTLVGTGATVQDVLEELDNAIVAAETSVSDHLADTADAHDASAVSIADAAAYTATTDVEAALAEIYARLPIVDTLAADVTVTEDATVNATLLSAAVKASKVYAFELTAVVSASVNGGVRLAFTVPAAATMEFTSLIVPADDTVAAQVGADQTNEVTYIAAALSEDIIIVKGRITVDATAGNVVVAFAQNTSHTDVSTLHAETTFVLLPVT